MRCLHVAIATSLVTLMAACGSDAGPSDSVVPSVGGSMPTTTLNNANNPLEPAPPNYTTVPTSD